MVTTGFIMPTKDSPNRVWFGWEFIKTSVPENMEAACVAKPKLIDNPWRPFKWLELSTSEYQDLSAVQDRT